MKLYLTMAIHPIFAGVSRAKKKSNVAIQTLQVCINTEKAVRKGDLLTMLQQAR